MTVANCATMLFGKVILTEIRGMEKQLVIDAFLFSSDTFSFLHEPLFPIFSSLLSCVVKSHCIQGGTTYVLQ